MRTRLLSYLLISLLSLSTANAENSIFRRLMAEVPADSAGFYYWAGNQAPGYENSDTQKLFQHFDLMKMYRSLFEVMAKQMPANEQKQFNELMKFNDLLYNTPIIMTFKMPEKGEIEPRFMMLALLPTQDKAVQVKATIDELSKQADQPAKGSIETRGQFLLMHNHPESPKSPIKNWLQSDRYQEVKDLHYEPSIHIEVNTASIVAWADEQDKGEKEKAIWQMARPMMGLNAFQNASLTGGFNHGQWRWSSRVNMNMTEAADEASILPMLQCEPLSFESLSTIPADSTSVGAFRMDLAGILSTVKKMVGKADEKSLAEIEQGLNMAKAFGIDVEKDLLGALGPQWSYYKAESVAGNIMTGYVMQNKLRHPDQFKSVTANMIRMSEMAANAAMQAEGVPVKLDFKTFDVQVNDKTVTINYLAMPLLAPCWAIHENTLLIAMQKQTLVAALTHRGKATQNNLNSHPVFTSLRNKLAGKKPISAFFYSNNQAGAAGRYQVLLASLQLISGTAELFGADLPPLLIPTYPEAKGILSKPTASFIWHDQEGLRYESQSAFPLSGMVGSSLMSNYQVAAFSAAILLPAIQRARETAMAAAQAAEARALQNPVR